ncbi:MULTISPECIES: potassium channel protein [unclassified Paenibacillus]|uniref:potassium channel protein n=1 Tax=unclassified Paenibacillus TaxID=185978 RepID=UPI00070A1AD3|nr:MULTISPECIES: potassium channel protein [unclassified Paenibacillus]KQX57287.1 ion transporter [Paenibacillus sp. Root444D2]KRE51349.1 ion transporter [Paenibacillus sp. Soil724D2]
MYYFSKFFLRLLRMNNKFIFVVAVAFIVLSSVSAYLLEKETFGSLFNGLWWVMTTVTTTGYGDYFPKTVAGKFLGMFLYIFGIGLISVTIGKVIDSLFVYRQRKEEGKLRYQGEQHFVIVDWSKNAELAIQEILNTDSETEIVLIDTLEKTPIVHDRVHYIQGSPTLIETLEKANMKKARSVFIFANETTEDQAMLRDPSFVDGKTLLVATTIERNYRNVHSIVEIKNSENMQNFLHVNVNEFILGSETISQLAVRSAFSPGSSRIVSQLLTRQSGDNLHVLSKRKSWSTYRDAFEQLLQEGATLISDGDQLNINRKLDQLIPEDARLFVICDIDTYERISKCK